jgi:glycosyltransferase involved in cell wall biosynthesis
MNTPHTPRQNHIVIDARIRRASTGRYVDRLLDHLQNIDHIHHYTILLAPDDTWLPHSPNFRPLPCPFPQFSFNPLDQIRFTRQLRKLNPDLVHFTMTQQPVPYLGRIVTTTHDLTMFRFVRRGTTPVPVFALKMGLYRFLVRWSHFKSDRIIVPTNFVAQDLIDYQPSTKKRIVVTYEASEPPLAATGKRPAAVEAHNNFLLYVGTAFPHKNLQRLVEAFDILHRDRPNLKLVLTGKHDIHRQELADFAKRFPSAKNIIFTGFVSDEELKWLYEHCAAYTFASLSEGFGLPPLEAMTYHAPVVASNASCIPEVCGDAAHYFDGLKPHDMAQKIAEVLDDTKLRAQLIKNGTQQVKKYSWERMAEETLIVYKAVLGE